MIKERSTYMTENITTYLEQDGQGRFLPVTSIGAEQFTYVYGGCLRDNAERAKNNPFFITKLINRTQTLVSDITYEETDGDKTSYTVAINVAGTVIGYMNRQFTGYTETESCYIPYLDALVISYAKEKSTGDDPYAGGDISDAADFFFIPSSKTD